MSCSRQCFHIWQHKLISLVTSPYPRQLTVLRRPAGNRVPRHPSHLFYPDSMRYQLMGPMIQNPDVIPSRRTFRRGATDYTSYSGFPPSSDVTTLMGGTVAEVIVMEISTFMADAWWHDISGKFRSRLFGCYNHSGGRPCERRAPTPRS